MPTAAAPKGSLADVLLAEGAINQSDYEKAIKEYERSRRSLVRIFQEMGLITERKRLELLQRTMDVKVVNLRDYTPSSDVYGYISREVCRKRMAVPLRFEEGEVVVAMEDPSDIRTTSDLEKLFGRGVKAVLATETDIKECIEKLPDEGISSLSGEVAKLDSKTGHRVASTLTLMLLVFAPTLTFYYWISQTATGQEWYQGFGFTTFENVLAFVVVWGSWAAVAYMINDLLFGESEK